MSKTKWYTKPIRRCELKLRAKQRGSVAILIALALVLSLGIVAVPMAGTVEADENIYYVNATTGTDNRTAEEAENSGTPWLTIQHAVDTVPEESTINVAPGIYDETIHVTTDNLTIQSLSGDPSDTIIDAGGAHDNVVTITGCSDVTLSGFTIKGGECTGGIHMEEASECSISNDVITIGPIHTTLRGIYLRGSSDNDFNSVTVSGQHGQTSYGFHLWDSDRNTFTLTRISDLTGLSQGILLQGSSHNSFIDTEITGLTAGGPQGNVKGISVGGGEQNTFTTTTISGLTGDGYAIGIQLSGNNDIISGFAISDLTSECPASPCGIWIVGASGNSISEGSITGATRGIDLCSDTGSSIHNTNFFSNEYGIYNGSDVEFDATSNWWGDAGGPSGVGPGTTGDAVTDYVDFFPWALDEGCTDFTSEATDVIVVDDDWAQDSDYTPVTVDEIDYYLTVNAFAAIQDGVNTVDPGGTINVAAGTYPENVTIDKTLILEGAQAGANARGRTGPESIIDAQGVPFAVLINGADTVATFNGFTVDNYDTVGILAGAFSDVLEGVTLGDDPAAVHILNNIVKPPIPTGDHNNCIQVGDGTTGTVIGNEVSGAWLPPGWAGTGILVAGSSDVEVSNNYAHDCELGISIVGYEDCRDTPAANNLVENNLVENNDCGISPQGNSIGTIIRDNDVLNNDVGIGSLAYDFSYEQSTPSGTEIHYNNIVGNENYGVESSVWWHHTGEVLAEEVDATNNWWGHASGPKQADTNPDGLGNEVSDNVKYSPWCAADDADAETPGYQQPPTPMVWGVSTNGTIQEAIDAADPGDIINVAAGTYHESAHDWVDIQIDESLSLIGAGSDLSVVELRNGPMDGVIIGASDVLIQGITFTKEPEEPYASRFNIRSSGGYNNITLKDVESEYSYGMNVCFDGSVTYQDLTLENCNIHHGGERNFYESPATTINHLTVTNSHFDNAGYVDPSIDPIGFNLQGTTTDLAITGGTFNNNPNGGLAFGGVTNATIRDVTVINSGTTASGDRGGIMIWDDTSGTSNIDIINPTVTNCGGRGIIVGTWGQTVSNISVIGGTVSGSGNNGVMVYSGGEGASVSGITLDGVTITGSGSDNVLICEDGDATVSDVTIEGCTIESATDKGIYFYGMDVTGSRVNHNNIENNGDGVFNTDGTGILDARYNWWGSANGPGQDGANGVLGDVDYSPWLPDNWELFFDDEGNLKDSDGDGYSDLEECWLGTLPDDNTSYPGAHIDPEQVDTAYVEGDDPSVVNLQDSAGTIADVDISGAPSGAAGTITGARYTDEPVPDGTPLAVGTGKTGVAFLDVRVTGYTSGIAHITVPYPDTDNDDIVDGTDIVEDTLGLYYWDEAAFMWLIAANSEVDTVDNNVSGDIPVTALSGTPISGGGYSEGEATIAIESITNLTFSGNDIVALTITTKDARLGATIIDLTFDPDVVEVLGGESSDFDSLTVNPVFDTGKARFVANQLGVTGVDATGVDGAVLAQVRLKAVGTTGSSSPLTLSVVTFLYDNDGIAIPYTITPGATATIGGLGDANSDGAVDVYDCVFIARAIAGISGYSVTTAVGDVSGDGTVDAWDCTYLARHIAGIVGYEGLGG